MNKMAAELVKQALNMIDLENHLKKMKINEKHKDSVERVVEYLNYEIMRCMKDLVTTERL